MTTMTRATDTKTAGKKRPCTHKQNKNERRLKEEEEKNYMVSSHSLHKYSGLVMCVAQ